MEEMSNLTSASGETSVSSGQQYLSAPPPQNQLPKRKRNLPGNPDPDAEVIALSPKTLLATNRFICEICNKGFQRDQNLQLHKRGHNLPWKLKQRQSNEVIRKKVYICPEKSCVHHDPARALGDLTGVKKHFCRKHGEKKWKCDKCSKKYAVQSDWKAHSKTCGTREYRCDCGTLFSRRDSFITHRAFCDALAEESARAITSNPLLLTNNHQSLSSSISPLNFQSQINPLEFNPFSLKKEHQNFNLLTPQIPPWLSYPNPPQINLSSSSSSIFPLDRDFSSTQNQNQNQNQTQNQNPNLVQNPNLKPHIFPLNRDFSPNQNHNLIQNPNLKPNIFPHYDHSISSPHMSATALLQKAAQMGATMSSNSDQLPAQPVMSRPHHQDHVSESGSNTSCNFGLNLSSSREDLHMGFQHGFASYRNKAPAVTGSAGNGGGGASGAPPLVNELVNCFSSGFDGPSFEDAFGGILSSKKDENFNDTNHKSEGMTRDFLGLRAFSHSDILNLAGLSNCMNSPQNPIQKPWQG